MYGNLMPRREDFLFPLQKEFDKLFDEFFGPKRLPSLLNGVKSRSGYPKLDIICMGNEKFRIELAVPGCSVNDVKVEIIPGTTTKRCVCVSGKMSRDYQYASEMEFIHRELTRARFKRIVSIPDGIDGDPETILCNGMLVLTWTLPAKESSEVKVIPVKEE